MNSNRVRRGGKPNRGGGRFRGGGGRGRSTNDNVKNSINKKSRLPTLGREDEIDDVYDKEDPMDSDEEVLVSGDTDSNGGPIKKTRLKVSMQVLHMSESSTQLAENTLVELRGSHFQIREKKRYKDTGRDLQNRFWVKDRDLIIKGFINGFSEREEVPKGLKVLDSYGFHSDRGRKALEISDGDVGSALELLGKECFKINYLNSDNISEIPPELKEQMEDEKMALESIYSNQELKIKIPYKLWEIKVNCPYLLKYLPSTSSERAQTSYAPFTDPKNCKFYLKGNCRYGATCKKKHYVKGSNPNVDDRHLKDDSEDKNFYLEIRFPSDCKYPEDSPLVFLKTHMKKFPPAISLKISSYLMKEAKGSYAGMPVVFSLVGLLEDSLQIGKIIKGPDNPYSFNPELTENCPLVDGIPNLRLSEDVKSNSTSRNTNKNGGSSYNDVQGVNHRLRQRYQDNPRSESDPMLCYRKQLPAWNDKDRILNLLKEHPVVVVSGMTGCGKSTQVPQYILDDWLSEKGSKRHCNIIVTQPRRISAIGVAERVAQERNEKIGNLVGYSIRLETKASNKTRLLFCTTGILLRRLEGDADLKDVTHVFVDEVHERSEESDFLLLILRDLLLKRKDLKIILMSATLNADLFVNYFKNTHIKSPPIVDIPGRTFPVKQLFLEEIISKCAYNIELGSPFARPEEKSKDFEFMDGDKRQLKYFNDQRFDETGNIPPPKFEKLDESLNSKSVYQRYRDLGYDDKICSTLSKMDFKKIDYDLLESALEYATSRAFPNEGSILVFLPGMAEISTLYEQLSSHKFFGHKAGKFKLLPLHGSLSSEEQSAIFAKTKEGVRKIVISTNIAETSITIDDCVFVIDSGRMKEKRFDPLKNMESLDTVWVSRANALQRKGRAGRVRPGVCLHLYSEFRYEHHFHQDPIPEIQRVPLEKLILRIKILPFFKNDKLEAVLQKMLEPPSKNGSDSAKERLKSASALDEKSNLTPLGYHLANLPVDVKIGKLLIFGSVFRCLDSALTIAATLSYRSPFTSSFGLRDELKKKRNEFVNSYRKSDQLTDLKAYNKWREVTKSSRGRASSHFARENMLSFKTLQTLVSMKHQFAESLSEIGFISEKLFCRHLDNMSKGRGGGSDVILEVTDPKVNSNNDNEKIILSVLCGALYPNVVQVLSPEVKFKQTASGAMHKPHSADEVKLKTKADGYVSIHPSSVNHGSGCFSGSSYLIYHEKVKTSKVFVRNLSVVPVYPMILFGQSNIRVELVKGQFVISMDDGWIKFVTSTQNTAELLSEMRTELDQLLESKIKNPNLDLLNEPRGNMVINAISKIISNE
uniref:Putative ATP-dependent RNA helicase DHX57 n=1 Tax=Lepeophtheirus salmonis TaxID=72036 RepID=A0A0K2UZ34_LEPSM